MALLNGLVDHQNVFITGLAFPDGDRLPGFESFDIGHFELKQIPDPKPVVDAHNK